MSVCRTYREWVLDDFVPAVASKIDKELMATINKQPMNYPTTRVIYGVQIQCTTEQALRILRRCTGTPAHLNVIEHETLVRNKASVPPSLAKKFAKASVEFIHMVLGHIEEVLAEDRARNGAPSGDGDNGDES